MSVIIATKNRATYVCQAIESVLAVDGARFNVELVVVDDGSTDNTATVVRQYPVVYIRTVGVGMARARNEGLRAATGDYVTLLDDDDVWLRNNIALQLEFFERHPEYGSVHAQAQLTHEDLTPYGEPIPPGPLRSGWIFEDLLAYWPQVGTILTRASVAREVGELDPSLTGDTDWDWLLRIARRYPIGRVAEPVLLFRQRASAEEQLAWRRFPAMVRIFERHTRDLSLARQIRLRPILWRHRGWWSAHFLDYARRNYALGEYRRAYRSLWYAFRCSPFHTLKNVVQSWPLRSADQAPTDQPA